MNFKIILLLSIFILFIESITCLPNNDGKRLIDIDPENEQVTRIPTSCVGLEDGYHYIKLLQDDIENSIQFPILHVLCDNEYIIIDYSIEPEWDNYFTTDIFCIYKTFVSFYR